MHNAALYAQSNAMERRDAQETIDKWLSMFQWREDGLDSLLDIGTGTGDVLMDFILPIMPKNFVRLVGSDASEEMVDYCRKQYSHPKISFEHFDLGFIDKQPLHNAEPFDHITSFHSLHWEQNQKRAVKNMRKLLRPAGDMLLVFQVKNPVYEIYKQMSHKKKWAKYMEDVDLYISPYQYSENPAGEFHELLAANGFTEHKIEIREKSYVFEGTEALLNGEKAVNPFFKRIPAEDQDAYFEDYLKHVVKMGLALDDYQTTKENCRFKSTYEIMIAYAKTVTQTDT